MAKSRSRGRMTSRRRPVDWVVNDDSYGLNLVLPNATQSHCALTFPKFWASMTTPDFAAAVPNYSYPEQDEGQIAYAIRGDIQVSPGTWAVGSTYNIMMRLVVKPIEYDTGGFAIAITDANYSLFQPQFANERILWQEHRFARQEMGSQSETVRVRWKGAVRIGTEEAIFLFIENQSGITQTMAFVPYLRTLMRADE